MRNYVRQSYDAVFPTEQDSLDFLEEQRALSPLALEHAIENYMGDDDDDDLPSTRVKHGALAESWRAYLAASLLIRKSKTNEDLERAMEVLEDVECCVKGEFESWTSVYMMEEYKD